MNQSYLHIKYLPSTKGHSCSLEPPRGRSVDWDRETTVHAILFIELSTTQATNDKDKLGQEGTDCDPTKISDNQDKALWLAAASGVDPFRTYLNER